jgi:septal ring factor EnvC (AmiA/AmiB activator)
MAAFNPGAFRHDTVPEIVPMQRGRGARPRACGTPAGRESAALARLRHPGLLLLGCLLAAGPLPDAFGETREDELARLRARIQALQENLNTTRGQRDAVREEVQGLERRIGEMVHNLRQLDRRLKTDGAKLDRLRTQARSQRRELQTRRASLERQIRAAYVAGRQEHLKLLLNQEDPALLARVLTYHQYVQRARVVRISALRSSLAELDSLERKIGEHSRELAALRDTQSRQKIAIEATRARRAELLAGLNRQVSTKSQEIERLRADEARLAQLLGELKTYLTDIPLPRDAKAGFARARGRLPLPTRGRIATRFGEPKPIGNLRWRGILVAGQEGGNVISVYRGRVVYADWLRGFGLLLILDHGDGYMTLYGHNQSLHKQVGDRAEAGEVIASVGNTGDAARAGVYFEIRHNGEPRDPLLWCKAR